MASDFRLAVEVEGRVFIIELDEDENEVSRAEIPLDIVALIVADFLEASLEDFETESTN